MKCTIGRFVCVWRLSIYGMLLAAAMQVNERVAAAPVIANPAPAPLVTTQWQQEQPSEMDVFIPFGAGAANPLPKMFRYGTIMFRPHASYGFSYASGIQSSPSNQQDTAIQSLSIGFLANLGRHWSVDYTPTFQFYSNGKFINAVDQSVALTGGFQYGDWQFSLSQGAQFSTAPQVETGAQTEQSSLSTGFTASRALSSKTSADIGLSQGINLVSGFQDSYDWSTMDWLNYVFWPRLNAGLGVGGGYVMINDNSQTRTTNDLDQTYESVNARVNWRATRKISFQVSVGLEDRQFKTPGTGDSVSPVYGVTIQYQPFQTTQISLSANRSVSSSDYYLQAQQTETTSFSAGLSQRVLQKFTLAVGVSYGTTDYTTSLGTIVGTLPTNRTDDNVSFNISLSHPFFKRGTWSASYSHSDNTSSVSGFGFASDQMGFSVSYSF